jgi:hypothetical protein
MSGAPGRLNVELASLANAILAYQKKPLTQVELYAALQASQDQPLAKEKVSCPHPKRTIRLEYCQHFLS